MSGYPGRAPTDPARSARVAASVIGILAAVGVLVASVVINDDPRPGGPVGSGGAAVGGSLDSGGATVGGTTGSGGTSASPTGTAPVGPALTPAQVRARFPLPADATPLPQPNSATTRETFETHVSPASLKAFYTARLPALGVIITLWTPGTVSGKVVAYETGYFRPGATPLFVHLAFDDTQLGNGVTFLDITVADHP